MNGILYVKKEKGLTSFTLCKRVQYLTGATKVGHTGTLDPNAEGVMVLLVGKASKANQFLVHDKKRYLAEVILGKETDTLDIEGEAIKKKDIKPFTKDELIDVLNSFLGKSVQIPPLTSAIKVKGKKLYQYQREGKEVDIPSREIEIFDIQLKGIAEEGFSFECEVSSGTYIRSLVRDIAYKLDNLATLKSLIRLSVDEVKLEDCCTLSDIEEGNYQLHNLKNLLIKRYPGFEVEDEKAIRSGKEFKADCEAERIFLYKGEEALAIYEKERDIYRCVRGLF